MIGKRSLDRSVPQSGRKTSFAKLLLLTVNQVANSSHNVYINQAVHKEL